MRFDDLLIEDDGKVNTPHADLSLNGHLELLGGDGIRKEKKEALSIPEKVTVQAAIESYPALERFGLKKVEWRASTIGYENAIKWVSTSRK